MPNFIDHAIAAADRPAAIFPASGITLTRGELNAAANRAAHAFRSLGLKRGDCVALSITNRPEFLSAMLAAQRSGLFYVLLSTKLSVEDAAYVLADSGAQAAIFSNGSFAAEDTSALRAIHDTIFGIELGENIPDWHALTSRMPDTLPDDCSPGAAMLYSSGTTGRPKGIRKELPDGPMGITDPANDGLIMGYGVDQDTVFYCPCPLYHAAPHRFVSAALSAGTIVVIPDRFDAERTLGQLVQYGCTHSLWVPTMFHRLLRLSPEERARHDLSRHRHAVHGAAPCPVHVKRAMIEWWGPILDEYYGGSEGIGSSRINSIDWLQHPGSVGQPSGCKVHILDPDGNELPPGETGDIYFESTARFEYWKDDEKTRRATNDRGWRTFGDVGHVDADGFLYLTDRRHFMIISGGVNIYPQEIESVFLEHDQVRDAAVIGIPHEEFGQVAVAVIQPVEGVADADTLRDALLDYARRRLGPVKAPKRIELADSLPRHDTGKLYKSELLARFID
ncbi:MAG: AMP-binding protein [Candidatus Sphingomonas colombiensis]|nr:AMP-binding protein [Sphingomonas sp.]WEK44757.1 MAG: AMP-binding protein [Sphingomonas sp.]